MTTPTVLYDRLGEPLVRETAKAEGLVSSALSVADPAAIANYRGRRNGSVSLRDKQLQYGLYKSHSGVYSAVELIVQTASREALRYSDADHAAVPALETLFAAVNPEQDLQALLTETYRDIVITGESFWLKQRLKGTFVGLRRMLNSITFMAPDSDGHPDHVEQKLPRVAKTKSYDLDDVLFFHLSDPEDECRGLSPLAILDLIVSSDLQAQRTFQALFANGMVGNKSYRIPTANATVVDRNREYIQTVLTRPENAYKPTIFEGMVELLDKGDTKGLDAPFINGRKLARQEVTAVFSVPYSKLYPDEKGALGQAGKEADDITLKCDTIAPLQTMIAGVVNRHLLVKEFAIADLSLESPADQNARWDRIDIAVQATHAGITGNEIRTLILGLPTSDAAGMDEPLFMDRGVDLASGTAGPETVTPQASADSPRDADLPDLEPSTKQKPAAPAVPLQPAQKASIMWRLFGREKATDKKKAAAAAAASVSKKSDATGRKLRQLVDAHLGGTLSHNSLERAVRRAQSDNLNHAASQAARVSGAAAATPDVEAAVARVMAIVTRANDGDASAAQAAAWAEAEGGAGHALYQEQYAAGMGDEPLTWVVDPAADSCSECPQYDGETHPASEWAVFPGDLACSFMCRCELEVA